MLVRGLKWINPFVLVECNFVSWIESVKVALIYSLIANLYRCLCSCGLVLILNSLPATGRRVLTGCGMLRRIKAVAGEEAARDQAENLRSSRQTSVLEHRAR